MGVGVRRPLLLLVENREVLCARPDAHCEANPLLSVHSKMSCEVSEQENKKNRFSREHERIREDVFKLRIRPSASPALLHSLPAESRKGLDSSFISDPRAGRALVPTGGL